MVGRIAAVLLAFFAAAMSTGRAQPVLINENYRVPAQSSTAPTLTFEQAQVGSRIAGSVSVAEHDINFFVCDEANYQLWKSESAYSVIQNCGRCTQNTFSFTVGKPGPVRFVMDNGYSLLTSKDVTLIVCLTASSGGTSGGQNAGEAVLAKKDENGAALDATPRIRGRDYHGTVKARRFQISDSVSRYAPVFLDVDGDGNKDTVRVRFEQVSWVVDVRANGERTTIQLPFSDEPLPDGVWVDLAASYLTSDTKPVLLVKALRVLVWVI